MKHTGGQGRGAERVWRWAFFACAAASLLLALTLLPHLTASSELVRLRNALLLQPEPATHDWTPANVPSDYARDAGAPDALYAEIVRRHALAVPGDDWATAQRIAAHLVGTGKRSGGAIQADLAETYQRITAQGEGYCGDFVDVFTGLATAAGSFTRAWAFSFDGFGGHGHIFNEVWDREAGAWRMVDVFNNVYPVDATGRGLSATEFRTSLLRGDAGLRLVPLAPEGRPGFVHEHKAIDYYRRGLPEWYLWWGNNVFGYDQAPAVRTLGTVSRSLEQLGGIAAGVHPGLRVLATPDNAAQREALAALRQRVIALLWVGAATAVTGLGWAVLRRPAARVEA